MLYRAQRMTLLSRFGGDKRRYNRAQAINCNLVLCALQRSVDLIRPRLSLRPQAQTCGAFPYLELLPFTGPAGESHMPGGSMIETNSIRRPLATLTCLLILSAPWCVRAQGDDSNARLQADGLARISQWRDYVRRTGDARSTLPDLATAQMELKTAYDRALQANDYATAAWMAINLGDIWRYVNRWADAVPVYQLAGQYADKAQRADYQTKALARLAFAEMKTNQVDAAAEHADEAVRMGADCGNPDFFFDALDTASEVEIKRGNLPAASDFIDRALSLAPQLRDKQQLYLAYGDRADLFYQKAQTYDCHKQYDVCFQAYERANADYQMAHSIALEAGFTFLANSYSQLIQGTDVQIGILKRLQARSQSLPAGMFGPKAPKDVLVTEIFYSGPQNASNIEMVKKLVQESDAWTQQMQRQGLTVKDQDPLDDWNRAALAEMSGDVQTALADYRQAVQLVEQDRRKLNDERARSSFMENKLNYYYRPALLLLQQRRYSEAFSLLEQSRSRTMADMLFGRELNLGTPRERELFSELQAQRTAIAAKQEDLFALTNSDARNQSGKKIADLEHEIEGMQRDYEDLENNIAAQAPRLKQLIHSDPVTLASLQSAAAQGEFDVLYYVVTDTALILWDVNASGVHVKNVFLPRSELIAKVSALRDSLESGRDALFDEEHARQLYLYLIQPMVPYLRTHHLVIIPHEELNSIPFQALLDAATGRYLGETYAISYSPSASVLEGLAPPESLASGNLLAVADPGLAAAVDEVTAIGKLYPNRSKVVIAATKADLESLVSNYSVVHLSMHGEFNQRDPLLSYVQLKPSPPDDGRLTAAEMFGLNLRSNAVTVLSACETGRVTAGHSNEVEGIVRALLYAGAGTLVLSAWKVDAAATSVWMQTFYREGKDKPPAEAARLALIAVKSQPNYSHPYFWAPFLLTGK
jgi:CHAT domain-containing protein/tetratricopeptide (TPR) repeat protein